MADHRRSIQDVLIRYATAIDERDWELLGTCFTEDVAADYGDLGSWTSRAELASFMDLAHLGFGASQHMMSTFAIEVDGDRATARSYVHAVLVLREDPATWYDAVGRYRDRLVLTDDGWRIDDRQYRTTRITSGHG